MKWTMRWCLSLSLLASLPAQADPPEENLIVFVGERLSVERLPRPPDPNTLMMDEGFKAKFRIKQLVYGRYDGEIIEFKAYDHYGRPGFDNYPHSLLFVSREDGKLYQQKYQFYPVFRGRSGDWAGCAATNPREAGDRRGIATAGPVGFGRDAFYPLDRQRMKELKARGWFAQPDFRIEGDKAYCLTGTSVHKLFEVKKRGVLKARGMFGGTVEP